MDTENLGSRRFDSIDGAREDLELRIATAFSGIQKIEGYESLNVPLGKVLKEFVEGVDENSLLLLLREIHILGVSLRQEYKKLVDRNPDVIFKGQKTTLGQSNMLDYVTAYFNGELAKNIGNELSQIKAKRPLDTIGDVATNNAALGAIS